MSEQPDAVAEVEVSPAVAPKPLGVRKGMWSQGTGDTSGYSGVVRTSWAPAPTAQPFGSYFDEIYDRLVALVPDAVDYVVVDRGVRIPPGLVVGEDPELDAARFRRTGNGVCLITRAMIDKLS